MENQNLAENKMPNQEQDLRTGLRQMDQQTGESLLTGLSGLMENTDGMMQQSVTLLNNSTDISPDQTQKSLSKKTGNELSKGGVIGQSVLPKPLFAPVLGLLRVKDKAIQVQSLLAQNRPEVSLRLVEGNPMKIQKAYSGKILTEKQNDWITKHRAPCGQSIAIEHLDWLSAHKRMENDVDRMVVIKRDYSDIIGQLPEYALVLAIVWFIEKGKGKWFPELDELKTKAEEFMVPLSDVYAETNAYILAKERFGEAIARGWFSRTILHERTIYGSSGYVLGWIRNNYLSALCDLVDDFQTLEEVK